MTAISKVDCPICGAELASDVIADEELGTWRVIHCTECTHIENSYRI